MLLIILFVLFCYYKTASLTMGVLKSALDFMIKAALDNKRTKPINNHTH